MPRTNTGPYLKPNRHGILEIRWTEGGRSCRLSTRTRDPQVAKDALGRFCLVEKETAERGFTFADAWRIYWSEHVEKEVIAQERLIYAWQRLEPVFGARPIRETTTQDILDYTAARRIKVGDATIRRELSALAASVNYLITTKRILSTETPFIPLPKGSPPKDRWLSRDEITHLLATAEKRRPAPPRGQPARLSRIERFVHLALRTGARRKAIERLLWSQVDFDRGLIDYNPRGARQSSKRRPIVPIATSLRPILDRAYSERTGPYVLDEGGSIRTSFDSLVRAAELEDVTRHTLRHTWATHAVMAGVGFVEVARVLGNTVAMVERVYAKYAPGYLQAAVDFEFRKTD